MSGRPEWAGPAEAWMDRALLLAARGWGTTDPNPMVGALVVEQGEVVAEGFHARAGGPHAEIEALRALGRPPAPEAVLVVTLEPCSTQGRTPPCTEAILAAGLRRVIVGAVDPNPAHAGAGLERLRAAGVEVVAGVRAEACAALNPIFNHWIVHRRPLLGLKLAVSLDGRIAARGGASQWITGPLARAEAMRWRRQFPATAVGVGTVLRDRPRLTVREEGRAEHCRRRLVIDARLQTAALAELPPLYRDDWRAQTVVVAAAPAPAAERSLLERAGVVVWELPAGPGGRIPAEVFRLRCAAEGLTAVLVEGGASLAGGWLAERAFGEAWIYSAPVLFGDDEAVPALRGSSPANPAAAVRLRVIERRVLGDDLLTRGTLVYPPEP